MLYWRRSDNGSAMFVTWNETDLEWAAAKQKIARLHILIVPALSTVRAHFLAIGGGALKINFRKFLVAHRIGAAFHVQLHPKEKKFLHLR